MPTPRLDPQKRDEVLRLKAKGYSNKQVAEMADVSIGTVSNVVNNREEVDRIDEYAEHHREKFLELKQRFNKWLGNCDRIRAPKSKPGKRIKALAINDIHAPMHNEQALARAIHDMRGADECWIVGDFLDLFNFSRYVKFKRPFSPIEEFQAGQAIINVLAESFPRVRVLHGNHDERFVKWLARDKGIPPDIIEFLSFVHPEFCSPLAKMCAGIENVEMMPAHQIDYASYGYLHQIGDCVLSHAERFSKVPAKTPSDVLDVLKRKLEPMGVVKNFRVLCQAHTHCAGKVWGDYGVLTLEMGCLAKIPDYDSNPRMFGRQPIIGYTVIVQENGVTDENQSNFVRLA